MSNPQSESPVNTWTRHPTLCERDRARQLRLQAIAEGKEHYFTGVPCKYGHIGLRSTRHKECLECRKRKAEERSSQNQAYLEKLRQRIAIKEMEHAGINQLVGDQLRANPFYQNLIDHHGFEVAERWVLIAAQPPEPRHQAHWPQGRAATIQKVRTHGSTND